MGDTLRQLAVAMYKKWHAVFSASELPNASLLAGKYSLRWVSMIEGVDVMDEAFLQYDLDATEYTEEEELAD
jgi:hypothetical protein